MKIHLPELALSGRRLGRNVDHDPRSLRFLLDEAETVASVEWPRHIAILDQGNLGSCTGNATVGALGSGPLWDALTADLPSVPTLDEKLAVSIYSDAEKLDGGAGYPPEDEGSSGLSVAKVSKTRGYISGYQHATTLGAAHTAIQAGAFIAGTYWYSGMDQPSSEGVVSATGTIRGGHEYVCRQYDADKDLWWFDNSWGTTYGVQGRFAYDSATLTKLLAGQGDITSFVPLSAPAPTPTPPPSGRTLTFTDDEMAALTKWSQHSHVWREAVAAAEAWKAATG